MQKKILLPVIALALVLCLVLAWYEDHQNTVPDERNEPSNSESVSPSPSDDDGTEEKNKPGELENGLGWG